MRLIDADRLLEPRRIETYYHLKNGDIAIPLIDIKHAPTVNQWTPCSELLPKTNVNVLACGKNGGVYVAKYIMVGGCVWWYRTGTKKLVNPVAWMPLPEPYKGDEE